MTNSHPEPAHTPDALRALSCAPLGPAQALAGEPLHALLHSVPGWTVAEGCLVARFAFDSWFETLGFVNAVGWMAQAQDHHPEMLVGHNRCEVRWNTHSARGITLNDFICAAHTDALAEGRQAP